MRDKRRRGSAQKRSAGYRRRYKQVMLNRFIFGGIIIIIILIGTIIGVKMHRAGLETGNTDTDKPVSEKESENATQNTSVTNNNEPEENSHPVNNAANHKDDGMRIICIDAGHGGKDGGAEGDGTGYEKDDALKMALALQKALEKRNITVYMTRTDDSHVPLEERINLANDVKADLMVSIHRNEYKQDESIKGFETWVHSSMPADSTDAAKKIQEALNSTGYINDRGVKFGSQTSPQEDLYINSHCKGPSILMEMGFMSNSDDNYVFRTKTDELAEIMADALIRWFDAQGL